jgi:hypothetical protein
VRDPSPGWRPDAYCCEFSGCSTGIHFPIAKLLDFAATPGLGECDNLFGLVTAAHLAALATRREPARRLVVKCLLTEALYRRGWKGERVLDLLKFNDWLLRLPQELEQRFNNFRAKLEGRCVMPYLLSVVRAAKEEGLEEGRELGRQEGRHEGRQEGRQEGRLEGLREGLSWLLAMRFGVLSDEVKERIAAGTEEELKRWSMAVLAAATLREVFRTA